MANSDSDTNGSFEFVDKNNLRSETEESSSNEELESKENVSEPKVPVLDDGWEDILGSGSLLKKTTTKGHRDVRPYHHDVVDIKYELRYEGQPVESVERMTVHASDSEIIQGLDMLIPLMTDGEVADVKINERFAFGGMGLNENGKVVPPNANIEATLQILGIREETPIDQQTLDERLEIGIRKKNRGNWWFSRDEFNFAAHCYTRSLEYLTLGDDDKAKSDTPDDEKETNPLTFECMVVLNNLAATYLKKEAYKDVIHTADAVLSLQPTNVKALFRKAKALVAENEIPEAINCLTKALASEPNNTAIRTEFQKLTAKVKNEQVKERVMYQKMFEPQKEAENERPINGDPWRGLRYMLGSLVVAVVAAVAFRVYSSWQGDTVNK